MKELQELELDEIANWPYRYQLLVAVFLAIALFGSGYVLHLSNQQLALGESKWQEQSLRERVTLRAKQVAVLPLLQGQIEELSAHYQTVSEQLPEESELANLFSSVSRIGLRYGLQIERIEWGERIEHAQYYALPLDIELTGSYQNIGRFAQAIAHLSRIVSLNDFKLSHVPELPADTLALEVAVTTYQFKAPLMQEEEDDG